MELNEIETKADELLAEVLGEEHASRAEHAARKMRCLREAAHIKALCNNRAEHNVAVDMRQRELAAMEQVAANMPTAAPCGEASPEIVLAGGNMGRHYCRYPSGHDGPHRSPQGTEWGPLAASAGGLSEVRALIAMWNGYSRNQDEEAHDTEGLNHADRRYAAGQSVAWGKAASILQEVMQKEGLL